MSQDKWAFYNRQYAQFGQYGGAQLVSDAYYPDGDPEAHFKEIVLNLGASNKTLLDIGSGSGGFTLSLAPYYGQIMGIEPSDLIQKAIEQQQAREIPHVEFQRQDGYQTSFADRSFEVIISRRGPYPRAEIDRLLRPGGHFVHIGIGYEDARSLKDFFGRGQMFNKRGSSLDWHKGNLQERGYQVQVLKDYLYDEYYEAFDDLNAFLQRVPIFEDYGSEEDRALLKQYVAANTRAQGIWLGRHRHLIHAIKQAK
ncbi:MAG: methyltransferase domain-containing protein [candidate division Zixibacteria bacterium]|nr:methyltransferase domain-containing protein [candidate division Zixibacteria bacterium]